MTQIITYNCDCCKKITDQAYKPKIFGRQLDICLDCARQYSLEFIIRKVWPTEAEKRMQREGSG